MATAQIKTAVNDKQCFQAINIRNAVTSMGVSLGAAVEKSVKDCKK